MNPGFTGSPLDRVDHIRSDEEAYGKLLSDWRARILGLEGLDPMISPEGGLHWQSVAEIEVEVELILLGVLDNFHWWRPKAEYFVRRQSGAHFRCCLPKMPRYTAQHAA